jgi:phosphopantetheinyl transferase
LDLEAGGDKAWRGRRVFLSPSELALVEASELGGEAAALRAWSCKEAAAKLCGLTLTRAWAEVEVRALGRRRSLAAVNGAVLVCRHGRRPVPLLTVIVAPEGWSRP